MKKLALLVLFPVVALAACHSEPPPPPQNSEFIGVVREVAGNCNTILGDNGTSYALHAGILPANAAPGARVRILGTIDATQDCPGRTLLRADGGVTVLAEAPMYPPVRSRGSMSPK